MSETLLIEVGHTNCISEAILLTVCQPSQEGTVGEEVDGSCREVYLVQSKLRYLKAVETSLRALHRKLAACAYPRQVAALDLRPIYTISCHGPYLQRARI